MHACLYVCIMHDVLTINRLTSLLSNSSLRSHINLKWEIQMPKQNQPSDCTQQRKLHDACLLNCTLTRFSEDDLPTTTTAAIIIGTTSLAAIALSGLACCLSHYLGAVVTVASSAVVISTIQKMPYEYFSYPGCEIECAGHTLDSVCS
jgi:hypothetical protein